MIEQIKKIAKIRLDINNIAFFLAETTRLESDSFVISGHFVIDAKSLMGIYSLDFSKPLELGFIEKVDGEEKQLIERLKELKIVVE